MACGGRAWPIVGNALAGQAAAALANAALAARQKDAAGTPQASAAPEQFALRTV